jgi:tetratricopeptide (TPR) repeat protein
MSGGTSTPETIDREIYSSLAVVNPLPDDESIPLPFATAGSWYRTRGDMAAGGPAGLWYQQALTELLRARRIDLALRDELRRRNLLHGKTLPYESPSPGLYLDLGRVYLRLSQPRQAIEALEYGRLLSPQPDFSEELGHAYRAAGDDRQAAVALHEGILLTPGYRRFGPELVDLYRKIDSGGCALVAMAGNRTALNLQCPLVADTSCEAARNVLVIYDKLGRRDEADRLRSAAMRDWSCPAGMFR